MGLYDKNGTYVGTPSPLERLEQIVAQMNTSNFTSDGSQAHILDDEDEFSDNTEWMSVHSAAVVMYDVNMALAITQSLIGLVLMLTIVDKNVREKPPIWHIFHLTAMTVFVGLVLHSFAHARLIYTDMKLCYFVIYGVEYAYFALSMGVVVFDIEIYFSKLLTLPRWEYNHFSRFLISILIGWVVVCFLVAHVVINNNESTSYFCFILKDPTWRLVRVILRELVPAIVSFIFILVSSATYVLKRSRISFMTTSGELKEVRSEGSDDEAEWLRCSIFLNSTIVVRGVVMVIVYHYSVISSPAQYRWLLCLLFIHVQSLYTMPFCLFFISDIRAAIKKCVLLFLNKASFGKYGNTDDREDLAVSFGNVSINS